MPLMNEKTGTIKIDWAAIDKVKDSEKGAAIEAYISKLEELAQQFEDTRYHRRYGRLSSRNSKTRKRGICRILNNVFMMHL